MHDADGGREGARTGGGGGGLPFDEEAKLVYGVVLSLRNMVKKLAGRSVHSLFRRRVVARGRQLAKGRESW